MDLQTSESNLTAATTSNVEVLQELAELQEKIRVQKQDSDKMTRNLAVASIVIPNLRGRLDSAQQKVDKVEVAYRLVLDQLENAKNDAITNKANFDKLVDKYNNEISELKQENSDLRSKAEISRGKIKEATETLTKTLSSISGLINEGSASNPEMGIVATARDADNMIGERLNQARAGKRIRDNDVDTDDGTGRPRKKARLENSVEPDSSSEKQPD